MCLFHWNTNVFSESNISPTLSTCMLMGYSTKTPTNNKITQTNSISQNTCAIAEYSASVTDSVTIF